MSDMSEPDQDSAGWRLEGYDTFSREYYHVPGRYASESEAEEAARRRLAELETTQPASQSGGQGPFGIQDRVYIVAPDGSGRRFTG